MSNIMSLNSPPGTKIKFSNPDSGYPYDQRLAQKFLVANGIYTIEKVSVEAFSSSVQLKEIQNGISFNTVLFSLA